MNIFWWVYLSVIMLAGGVILFRIRIFLDRLENFRKKSLQKVTEFSPIPTESPKDKMEKYAKDFGIRSIETRFSLIKRIFLPLIFLLWLLLITIPFLPMISAISSSIIVAFITGVIVIATKPIVENAIAGILISFAQPIRIGDTVKVDNSYGTIEEITITHTKLKLWSWQRHIIPNRILLEKEFLNYSIVDEYIWAYVEFWVSYEADMDLVEKLAIQSAKNSNSLLNCEDPSFWIMGLKEESICCWIAGWAESPWRSLGTKNKHSKRIDTIFSKRRHRHSFEKYTIPVPR